MIPTLDELIERDAKARYRRGPGIGLDWDRVTDISKITLRRQALEVMPRWRRVLGMTGNVIRAITRVG